MPQAGRKTMNEVEKKKPLKDKQIKLEQAKRDLKHVFTKYED